MSSVVLPYETWTYHPRQSRRCRPRTCRGAVPTFGELTAPESLMRSYDRLSRLGGQAPGPDGVRYKDLSRSEAGALCREMSRRLQAGNYCPGDSRQVQIPKANGKFRSLTLRNIPDRVVARTLADGLGAFFESLFLPESVGFRPGKGIWDVLAGVVVGIERGLNVLASDDIRQAFDHVNIPACLTHFARHIRNPDSLSLVESILKGGNPDRTVGIGQGCPFSPLALNVRLHYMYDSSPPRPDCESSQDTRGRVLRWRYADNLVILCPSLPEGQILLEQAHNRLAGSEFSLKSEDGPPRDLRQQSANLLGYQIQSRAGKGILSLKSESLLLRLRQRLIEAYRKATPAETAHQIVVGQVALLGPVLETCNASDLLGDILRTVTECGFREIGPIHKLETILKTTHQRWLKRLEEERSHQSNLFRPLWSANGKGSR